LGEHLVEVERLDATTRVFKVAPRSRGSAPRFHREGLDALNSIQIT
jgi:hypothetical protein